jgi:hypothetical protein
MTAVGKVMIKAEDSRVLTATLECGAGTMLAWSLPLFNTARTTAGDHLHIRTWCETTSVGWTSESVLLQVTDSEVHLTNPEVISHQVLVRLPRLFFNVRAGRHGKKCTTLSTDMRRFTAAPIAPDSLHRGPVQVFKEQPFTIQYAGERKWLRNRAAIRCNPQRHSTFGFAA